MKLKFKLILVLLVSVAFTYTACKKSSSSNPSGPALAPQAVSTQIALNLAQTLYDGFGAFSINDGLNAPVNLGVIHHKGPLVNDLSDSFCGLVVDTTLNFSTSANGTSASVKGTMKFSFTCSNGVFSGYNINDNLTIAESTSQFSVNYQIGENLTLLSLNPSSETSNFSLNGSLNSDGSYQYKTGSKQSADQSFNYTLKSLIIDSSSGDIISGSASFSTKGSGSTGSWNYQGTITFLGNYKATIVINGASYTVNLQTGQAA